MALFDYVPVMLNPALLNSVRVSWIDGVSTIRNANAKTDRGRLYANLTGTPVSGPFQLDLFSSQSQAGGTRVLTGTVATLDTFFALTADNNSGLSGQASVVAFAANDASGVAVVSFADDVDCYKILGDAQRMPGYHPTFGLAAYHADAARYILTTALPAAMPHLFGPKLTGVSSYFNSASMAFPDLRGIANPDELRIAQAQYVKFLSADQKSYVAEFKAMADQAMARFKDCMENIRDLNLKEEEAEDAVSTSEVCRG